MQEEPTPTYHLIRGAVIIVVFLVLGAWGFYRMLKRSEDPVESIVKWVVSILVVGGLAWWVKPFGDGLGGWHVVVAGIIGGAVLAVLWRRNLGEMIAGPFASLFDGGNREIEPEAHYSVAEARRNRGKYTEAVAEIRKQLDRFPADVHGHMLLAEIQAENLNDLPGAEVTLLRFCNQPGHAPRNVAFALNRLADLHLKHDLDREAARQALEKVIEKFPNTDMAESAKQRIAHLASVERMLEPHDRKTVVVQRGVRNLGLLESSAQLAPAESDPEKVAAELVEHLVLHPNDAEAREKLAIIYTDHYRRPDLAADQLNQLIEVPHQTPKNVARWLNLLADLQVRGGADYGTVRKTLERIVELLPNHSATTLARNRIDKLKLEFKGRAGSGDIKLGTYEQYLGLKQGRPGAG